MAAKPITPRPEVVARLLEHYHAATPAEVVDGGTWYYRAYTWAAEVADRHGLRPENVAGAVAALSPLREWGSNLEQAAEVTAAITAGEDPPPVHFWANVEKAAACIAGEDPDTVLGGDKVRSFYAAICGEPTAVTIDRWALLAAAGQPVRGTPSARQYRQYHAEYTAAAEAVGEEPAAFQAIVWVRVRNQANEVPDL